MKSPGTAGRGLFAATGLPGRKQCMVAALCGDQKGWTLLEVVRIETLLCWGTFVAVASYRINNSSMWQHCRRACDNVEKKTGKRKACSCSRLTIGREDHYSIMCLIVFLVSFAWRRQYPIGFPILFFFSPPTQSQGKRS